MSALKDNDRINSEISQKFDVDALTLAMWEYNIPITKVIQQHVNHLINLV